MARILGDPLAWSFALAALMLAGWATDSPFVAGLVPLIALAAWSVVLWRTGAAVRERRAAAAAAPAPAAPPREPALVPRIVGTVEEPQAGIRLDPDALQRKLAAQIIGQDAVCAQLARGVYRRLAQERRGKPVFTALLSGPTGTGKTEFAKALAVHLFGSPNALFRIDCANVIGEAGLQTLIGSPKGYAGSQTWGALTGHLRANPRSVVLFDEIEKAVTSPTAPMAKLLLSLLDEGVCTEQSDGTRVSATESVILLTSNAAQAALADVYARYRSDADQLVRATKDALRDHFAPEFLARLDLVTTLAPLDSEARRRIIALHTGRIGQAYGVAVREVDGSFVTEALRRWGTLEGYGTREIIRWIENALADVLIAAKERGARPIRIAWRDGRASAEEP